MVFKWKCNFHKQNDSNDGSETKKTKTRKTNAKKSNRAGKMYNNNQTDFYEYNTKSSRKPAKREKNETENRK